MTGCTDHRRISFWIRVHPRTQISFQLYGARHSTAAHHLDERRHRTVRPSVLPGIKSVYCVGPATRNVLRFRFTNTKWAKIASSPKWRSIHRPKRIPVTTSVKLTINTQSTDEDFAQITLSTSIEAFTVNTSCHIPFTLSISSKQADVASSSTPLCIQLSINVTIKLIPSARCYLFDLWLVQVSELRPFSWSASSIHWQ
jgi:hypothetical protein